MYFYGGWLSNFAPTPGLRLPFGYHGHHENDRVPVRTVEHWFQACKATSRQQFDLILACGTAAAAKRAGRETELRPDWEQVKFEVMLCALRGKFALEPYRSGLLLTHPRPLAEDSPSDYVWGARDPRRRPRRPEPARARADARPRRADRRRAHPPGGARSRPAEPPARRRRARTHDRATPAGPADVDAHLERSPL